MITKRYKIYGLTGHRQRESFTPSHSFQVVRNNEIIKIDVLNSDKTGTNEYTALIITASTPELCEEELNGQLSDGIFENSRTGNIVEF